MRISRHLVSTLILFGSVGCDATERPSRSAATSIASDHVVIPDEITCPECRIVLEPVEVLGAGRDSTTFSNQTVFRFGADGSLLARDPASFPQGMLYRAPGDSTWIQFGRTGEGPGEFGAPTEFWVSDEGLHVIDVLTGRETVFDRSGAFVSTHRLPAMPHQTVRSKDGTRIIAAIVRTPEAAGYPLHALSDERQIQRSFGADTALMLPGMDILLRRAIAPAGGGGVWAARPNEYRIEEWTPAGERIRTVSRAAPWFEPWTRREGNYTTHKPPPQVISVEEDESGYLWVVLYLPDRNYRPSAEPGYHGPVDEQVRLRSFDTRIEVLDPASGTLLARMDVDSLLRPFAGPLMLSSRGDSDDGFVRAAVWRMRVITPSKGP